MAKLHYQKLASSPPGKLEHPSNPPPPIFPGKKLWIDQCKNNVPVFEIPRNISWRGGECSVPKFAKIG